jgi:MYXO-CTERM domain-containing protein
LQGSVGAPTRPGCKPDACDCVDLGDIEVEFEEPRLCDITLNATFSGVDVVGGEGPLVKGDAVAGASVRASLTGGAQIPQAGVAAVCSGQACTPGPVPESGKLSFSVPVIGDAPKIQLDASWSSNEGGKYHYYSGSLVVDACTRDQTAIEATAELELDHSELSGFGEFIASLGDAVKTPSGSDGTNAGKSKNPLAPGGCGCRAAGGASSGHAVGLLALLGLGLFARRRGAYSTGLASRGGHDDRRKSSGRIIPPGCHRPRAQSRSVVQKDACRSVFQ